MDSAEVLVAPVIQMCWMFEQYDGDGGWGMELNAAQPIIPRMI